MKKIASWSFSAIEQFRNCPRQYQAERVTKEVPYVEGPHQKHGNWVHKMFEDRLNKGRALPPELKEFEPTLKRIKETWPAVRAEMALAIDDKLQPTEYFSKTAWCRAKIDVCSIGGALCRVVDTKTGKRKYDYDQLLLNALIVMCHFPEVQTVKAAFFWTKESDPKKRFDVETFKREHWHDYWQRFLPDVALLQQAMDLNVWQEKPSGLCNGWCRVESCPYWKPRRENR